MFEIDHNENHLMDLIDIIGVPVRMKKVAVELGKECERYQEELKLLKEEAKNYVSFYKDVVDKLLKQQKRLYAEIQEGITYYTHVHICTYIRTDRQTDIHTITKAHIHLYAYTHTHTHTHTLCLLIRA